MRDDVMGQTSEAVLDFWIGEVGPEGWYSSTPDMDNQIAERFGPLRARAATGALDGWIWAPRSGLALMILLDQFPRNMFRGQADAFATDAHALALAKCAITRGLDLSVPEPERQFFYLPLMHSECLADQQQVLLMVQTRLPRFGSENLDHGRKHRDVIRRFGRFPSRNAALGRKDTAAELAYRAAQGYMS